MAKWSTLKKKLPYAWAKKVVEILSNKGFDTNTQFVHDVRGGRIKDAEKQALVWEAIHELASQHKTKKQSVKKLAAA